VILIGKDDSKNWRVFNRKLNWNRLYKAQVMQRVLGENMSVSHSLSRSYLTK
jgi:hypothetical protein